MNKFWRLYHRDNQHKLAEWVNEEMDLESILCPVNSGHQHVGRRLTDLSILLPGNAVEDFVWTWYSECLIQDNVLHFLLEQGFTGFDVKPVKARFKKKKATAPPPKLWELVVTGWAGIAAPESGLELRYRCDACGHTRFFGLSDAERLIDNEQWDGSDLLMVWPLPRFIFVTDRFAQSIIGRGFTGANFVALAKLGLKPTDGFSADRLSYFMPDERARAIGEPLGIY